MPLTAIIYESNCQETETAVKDLMMIIGAGQHYKSSEFPAELQDYYSTYTVGGPVTKGNMDERITGFVGANRDWLCSKRIFLFGLVSRQINDDSHFAPLKEILGKVVLGCEDIIAAPGKLDLVELASTGLRFNEKAQQEVYVALPPEKLRASIEKFLTGHKFCVLSTAYGDRVRGNTQTYVYQDGYLYLPWEGQAEFANLILNDNVCIAVHDFYEGASYPARMQLYGKAEILELGSDAYKRMWKIRGWTEEQFASWHYIMWGITVKIERVEFWWTAEWKRLGVGRKQTYYFNKSK